MMIKKDKSVTFKTVEEYRAFYASDEAQRQFQGGKYYRIGAGIAEMACGKAVSKLLTAQAPQPR